MEEERESNDKVCKKCHGTGIVKEGNGAIHTCWDCMQEGKLDQHSEKLPDNSNRFKL